MEPVSNSGQGLRHGLSRLRRCWQSSGCNRHIAVSLLVHLSLDALVSALLLRLGCRLWMANLAALVCALFISYRLEQAIDAKLSD